MAHFFNHLDRGLYRFSAGWQQGEEIEMDAEHDDSFCGERPPARSGIHILDMGRNARLVYDNRKACLWRKDKTVWQQTHHTEIIRIFITFNIVSIAWIFFRVTSIGDALEIIGKIFTSQERLFIDAST